ncbi:TlpA family protein disulfide reductase [Thiocapsa bogorovii]|nr:TlpA family protein disulfide reductase [Thiocapsa bogorovii]
MNFWASWCPPCLAEMPSLQRLAQGLAGHPFHVAAVNVDETPRRAVEAMRRLGYEGQIVLDPDQTIFHARGAKVLPSRFLIGCDGRLRFQALGPPEWDSTGVSDETAPAPAIVDSARVDPIQNHRTPRWTRFK